MRETLRDGPAPLRRHALDHIVESNVGVLPVEEVGQLRPQCFFVHRQSGSGCLRFAQARKAGHYVRHNTRITSDRVMMNVLSVLKSRTSTAGFCGVIIVARSSTGMEMSTN